MKGVSDLLQLGVRIPRESEVAIPVAVLDGLLKECDVRSGVLGRGDEVLVKLGSLLQGCTRFELPVGRDNFWLELDATCQLAETMRLAASVVLGSWAIREDLKKARFAERRRIWEVESLRAIAEGLGGTLDSTRIADEILLHASALLDARRGEVWLSYQGATGAVSRLDGAAATGKCADGGCIVAARVGGTVLSEEEASSIPANGLLDGGRLAVPVTGRRGRLGVIALAEREVRGGTAPFALTDTETLTLFAAQAAVALENAILHQQDLERERLERELELAAAVQRELLPTSLPTFSGYQIGARSLPSRQVGGDVFDLVPIKEGLFVMLGDVAGKGVPAALMAASLQAAQRVLVQRRPLLSTLAAELHAHILGSTPENKFATVFLGFLNCNGELEFVSAGHNPVVLTSAQGEVQLLGATGPPFGLLEGAEYACERVVIPHGATLLAYTDGLSEAPSPRDEEDFGVDRIARIAVEHTTRSVHELIDSLFTAVDNHTAGAPPHDDRTVLVVRRDPSH